MKFTIIGETPSKKNSRILNTKTKRSFPNPRYIEWHDIAIAQVKGQIKDWKAPIPSSLTITFYHGDMKVRDSDNSLSSILDMLKDCGVLLDDRWAYVPHKEVTDKLDKGNARCEIEITEYKE